MVPIHVKQNLGNRYGCDDVRIYTIHTASTAMVTAVERHIE